MDIIRFTIRNPVKIAVGVILVCLFGMLTLFQIPIQLTPNVDAPKVTGTTRWPGKNAREVEREIVDRQEEKLKWKESAGRVDEYLGLLETLFSPDLFIVGGGVSKKHPKFLPHIKTQAKIVPAQLRNEAGIVGAALAAGSLVER